jgi:hypothetical protein
VVPGGVEAVAAVVVGVVVVDDRGELEGRAGAAAEAGHAVGRELATFFWYEGREEEMRGNSPPLTKRLQKRFPTSPLLRQPVATVVLLLRLDQQLRRTLWLEVVGS